MRIACPSCRKVFSVDEDRLPRKPATMKCPACGGAIPINLESQVPPPGPPRAADTGAAPTAGGDGGNSSLDGPGGDLVPGSERWERLKREVAASVLEQLGVQVKTGDDGGPGEDGDEGRAALVCEDEALFQLAVSEALEKLGYRPEVASSKKTALDALQKKSFALVTVDNRLPDDPEGGYGILRQINVLPPEMRRKMFVAFISADLTTMDSNSAFILGANLTVAKKDIKRLDKILAQGIREHERKYHLFREVEEEIQRTDS